MTQAPPSLNYVSATPGQGPLRKKAIRHCRGNGVASLILGLIVGLASLAVAATGSRGLGDPSEMLFVMITTLVYSLVYLVSGIIHLIASFKLKQSNPAWEKIVITVAGVHIAFIVIWIALLVWAATRTASFNILPFIVSIVVLLSLAKGINSTRQAATET
jgi:hypothetical protein